MLNQYKPDRVIPPSLHIAEFVHDRGWTIEQFAAAMGTTPDEALALISGVQSIELSTAIALGKAFGTSPDFWLNLQRNYEAFLNTKALSETPSRAVKGIKRRATLE